MSTEAAQLPIAAAEAAVSPRPAATAPPPRSYPIARWYLRPAADRLAAALVDTSVRPVHLTVCGLAAAVGATALLLARPEAAPWAGLLVLVHWFFDRADGLLARRQGTASAWGAWLDANVDELADVALHAAIAWVLAARAGAAWPWYLLAAFLSGKYLLMTGLATEEHAAAVHGRPTDACDNKITPRPANSLLRRAYHLPGNADVRTHLAAVALATGWLGVELAAVAVYYNLRWIARYALVARRLGGAR